MATYKGLDEYGRPTTISHGWNYHSRSKTHYTINGFPVCTSSRIPRYNRPGSRCLHCTRFYDKHIRPLAASLHFLF